MIDSLDTFDHSDSEWNQTRFFSSAHRNIVYFQSFVEHPLLEAPSSKAFTARLRRVMYAEAAVSRQRQYKVEVYGRKPGMQNGRATRTGVGRVMLCTDGRGWVRKNLYGRAWDDSFFTGRRGWA